MKKISVAMATFCGEKYIELQLQSLLNQSLVPDEVIICDDCSTDNTAKIVNCFIAKNNLTNWHFSVNENNLGFVKNFKQAIEKTDGDIIFLCDQDDIWHSDKIEKITEIFGKYPDASAVNASFEFIDGDGKPIDVQALPKTSNHSLIFKELPLDSVTEISRLEVIKGNISPGCTMAFTKELKDYYLEHTSCDFPHDHELNIGATVMGKLYFYNRELISYRIHSSNAIGLDTSGNKAQTKFNSNEEKRKKILKNQQDYAEHLKRDYVCKDNAERDYIEHLNRYVELRKDCIYEHKISSWFRLWKHYPYIKPNITKKQLLGDLIYLLKLQKYFGG